MFFLSFEIFWQMMKGKTPSSFLFIVSLLSVVVVFVHSNPDDHDDALTLELVHRDSPKWHGNHQTPLKTQRELIKERHLRDVSRQEVKYPLRKDGIAVPMESASDLGLGEYFAEITLGTPPRKFSLIVDTASDLTWLSCRYKCGGKDCHHRRKRSLGEEGGNGDKVFRADESASSFKPVAGEKGGKVFRADRSSSFKPIACSSKLCKHGLRDMRAMDYYCPTPSTYCMYNISYLGGNVALGFFGEEVMRAPLTTTGRSLKLRHMVIGCTESVVKSLKGDGILGLGYSFGSVADRTQRNFGPKFSYCLMSLSTHMNVTSYLTFGANKKAAQLPPMTWIDFKVTEPGHYGVNISGISVDGKLLDIPREVWQWDEVSNGGAIIDSGTTNTWLVEPAYFPVMAEYEKALSKYERVIVDPSDLPFELCFKSAGFDWSAVPKLAIHFENGAVFAPPVKNYFTDIGTGERCVALIKANTYVGSLIGNLLQQNHLWEFNLETQKIGFTPSSCT